MEHIDMDAMLPSIDVAASAFLLSQDSGPRRSEVKRERSSRAATESADFYGSTFDWTLNGSLWHVSSFASEDVLLCCR